jgi:hypothetical protein
MRRRLQSYKETIEASPFDYFYFHSGLYSLQQIERKLTSAAQQVQYTPQGQLLWFVALHR